jgi:hypothetical protein
VDQNPSTEYINAMMDAVDYLSAVLQGTTHPAEGTGAADSPKMMPLVTTNGDDSYANPMYDIFNSYLPNGKNDGYILTIGLKDLGDTSTIAAATYYNQMLIANQSYTFMPTQGYFYFSTSKINQWTSTIKPSGYSAARDVIVHEVLHALGVGTNWYIRATVNTPARTINRSFIVGRGDTCLNPNGTKNNLFYSTNTGTNSRTAATTETFTLDGFTMPESTYTEAYNPYQTGAPTISNAVVAYRNLFGVTVDGVPVESHATSAGSYGGHWA